MRRTSWWRGAYLDAVRPREGGVDVGFTVPYLNVTVTNRVSFSWKKEKKKKEDGTGTGLYRPPTNGLVKWRQLFQLGVGAAISITEMEETSASKSPTTLYEANPKKDHGLLYKGIPTWGVS